MEEKKSARWGTFARRGLWTGAILMPSHCVYVYIKLSIQLPLMTVRVWPLYSRQFLLTLLLVPSWASLRRLPQLKRGSLLDRNRFTICQTCKRMQNKGKRGIKESNRKRKWKPIWLRACDGGVGSGRCTWQSAHWFPWLQGRYDEWRVRMISARLGALPPRWYI